MHDQPQTWHYGLMAEWWAEFNRDATTEAPYFQACIEQNGQPALDIGCGNGRVLLPLLRAGLDVDGIDISPDMLSRCRDAAAEDGYEPNLYWQAIHALDLPRRYGTIYICDSFGIGGSREQDEEGLWRCYQHLAPGGLLVFNHYYPYDDPGLWNYWLPESRSSLPQPWPEAGIRRQSASGDTYELATRIISFDPLEQRLEREMRIALYRGDTLVGQEEHRLANMEYFRHDVLALLQAAGFRDITITAAYSDTAATVDATMVMFLARKEPA